jgi:hypothetical protein
MASNAKKPTAKFMLIDPATAQAWLENNTQNRRIRKRTIEGYVRDMTLGRWEVTGETICFGTDGTLIDGQHRLHACVRSGCAFMCLVAENVSGQANHDGGPRRTLGDMLEIKGVTYAKIVAQLVQCVAYHDLAKKNLDPSRRPVQLTLADFTSVYEKRPKVFEAEARESFRLYGPSERVFAPGIMGGLHMIFSRRSKEAAEWFRVHAYEGHGLGKGDAVYYLRRAFLAQKPGERLSTRMKYALLIKAFNATVKGEDLTGLRWIASGPRAEGFPEVVS